MTITDVTITVSAFNDFKAKLVSAMSTAGYSSVPINVMYNDKKNGRNQIVIEPPRIVEDDYSFGAIKGMKSITFIVEVYQSTPLLASTYADVIRTALNLNDIAGLDLISIDESYDFGEVNENKVHLKALSVAYQRE